MQPFAIVILPLLFLLCSCTTSSNKSSNQADVVVLPSLELQKPAENDQPLCSIINIGDPIKCDGQLIQALSFRTKKNDKTYEIFIAAVTDEVRKEFVGKDFYFTIPQSIFDMGASDAGSKAILIVLPLESVFRKPNQKDH